MNRKLITLAVAAAIAGPTLAPSTANAEAILYGKLNVSIDYVDVDANAYWANLPGNTGVPRSGGNPNWAQALGGTGGNQNNDFAQAVNPVTGALLFNAATGQPILSGRGFVDFPGARSLQIGASNNLVRGANTATQNMPAIAGQQLVGPVMYAPGTIVRFVNPDGTITAANNWTADLDPNNPDNRVYDVTFANAASLLQAAGVPAGLIGQVATNLALNAAYVAGTDAQRAAAQAQIVQATGGQSFKGWGMNQNSRASRIGVKGSEDLGNGLKAIYQVEIGVDMANDTRDNSLLNGNRGNGFAFRNTFVGLAGNWGSVLVGRHDTPMKLSTGKLDLFADTLADFNYTVGFQDLRADNVVAYISPSFSGFTFSAAIIPAGGATGTGVYNNDSDSIAGGWSLAGVYTNGPFYVSLAYESLNSDMFTESNPFNGLALNQNTTNDLYRAMFGEGLEDDTKLRVGLGLLDWNGFTLSGVFEQHQNINGAPRNGNADLWQIQAAYAFGNSQVKAMYGQAEVDACVAPFTLTCTTGISALQNADKSTWAIGFDHSFSKRTKVYTLYTAMDDDSQEADWSGFSLGVMHSF